MLSHCCVFRYTGALTLTPTNVVGLLQLADFYGVQPIKRACGDYLFDVLGESQLPALLDMAEAYTVKRLRQRCAQVLADDFEDLIDDGQLWALSPDVSHAPAPLPTFFAGLYGSAGVPTGVPAGYDQL